MEGKSLSNETRLESLRFLQACKVAASELRKDVSTDARFSKGSAAEIRGVAKALDGHIGELDTHIVAFSKAAVACSHVENAARTIKMLDRGIYKRLAGLNEAYDLGKLPLPMRHAAQSGMLEARRR